MKISTLQSLIKRQSNGIKFTEKYIEVTWNRYLLTKGKEDLKSYRALKRELAKSVSIQKELKNEMRIELDYRKAPVYDWMDDEGY